MSEQSKKTIAIPQVITVKNFADKAGLAVTIVISDLIKNGVLASINETIDFETAQIIGDDLGLEVVPEEEVKKSFAEEKKEKVISKNLKERPPVVTIMGHVDHGKTTLLDKIRREKVAETESGGITQHISAYQAVLAGSKKKEFNGKIITFIDTPGHAAFSAMREHGAAITDIVVLIVAANDGVMPQTLEVIKDAEAQKVPVIVAINKVDLPDADVMKVKQQLSDHGLIPEDWGGKTITVPVSAKTGQGIDDLLEMILLQAEVMDLKADPEEKAVGIVIESQMQKGVGPMAVVLVENGTLNRSEPIAIGSSYGKVRILEDFTGKSIEKASPSTPVRIAGLKSLPDFGARMLAFATEKEARENALLTKKAGPSVKIATAKKIGGDEEEKIQKMELNVIVKADVAGSLEAIRKSLQEIDASEYGIKIISEGVGAVSDSDITLAMATKAEVLGFRVNAFGAAKRMAEKENITVRIFQVIYELIDFAKEELAAILPPEIIEEELGKGKVLQIFRDDRKGFVAGGIIESGRLTIGDEIKFSQKGSPAEKYRAEILTLRREKSEVKECESGNECGFGLPVGANVAVGDTFVAFKTVKKKREIK